MSFYFSKQAGKKFQDVNLLHMLECKVCPLYNIASNKHKDIQPHGSMKENGIYVLGMGPGKDEDLQGKLFIGASGQYLRSCFTEDQMKLIRFGNVTRTRDPNDEPPIEAVECCRPSVERDIVLVKPRIIFGLGGYPLNWALRSKVAPSINAWRGHPFPVNIAGHVCWYYPMFHPAHITRNQFMDHVFKLDIANAYKFLDRNLVPEIITKDKVFENCYPLYNLTEIKKALLKLSRESEVSIDLETTPCRPYEAGAKILSISVGTKDYAIAFPWKHLQHKWSSGEFEELRQFFHKFLLNRRQKKIAHNASFEIEYLVFEFNDPRIAMSGWKDTMSSAFNLGYGGNSKDSDGGTEKLFKGLLSLDAQCRVHFGFFLKDFSSVDRTNLERESLDKVLLYNSGDTKWDHAISLKLDADVEYEHLESIVAEHDRRVPAVTLTQIKGLVYSLENVEKHNTNLESKIGEIYNRVMNHQAVIEYASKYGKFNISAPADVANLFKGLGFNVLVKDPEGNMRLSSDDSILKAIDHPVAKDILSYRELAKAKSTYVDIFLPNPKNYVVYPDGKIHGNFTTHFTTTGRLSSNNPNLQNFPKRKNKEIRDIIVAPPGHIFASCDFGQLEYRVLVMASKDPKLVSYVWGGQDIHAEWSLKIALKYPKRVGGTNVSAKWAASNIATLKDEDKLFKTFRDIVKNNFVFAAFYGAGVPKLAAGMGLPESITRELYEEFWAEFAGVKTWHEWAYKFYAENGYIETLTKRRRYAYIKGGEIINMPIQGTGSDIVIDGMNRLSEYAVETGQDQFQPVINVHDDLGFYLPEESWQPDLDLIIQMMLACEYPWINVPLTVEAARGPNWYKQEVYGTFDNSKELRIKLGI